jgi:hypothetical protein
MPLAILAAALLVRANKLTGLPVDYALALAVFSLQVLAGYGFWWLFEQRTDAIKRRLLPGQFG